MANPHLGKDDKDILHHFGIDAAGDDTKLTYKDVKFVCVGGSKGRMRNIALYLHEQLQMEGPPPSNLSKSERYVLYKVGPILIADHGIGVPSLCVMLHEVMKILHYAGCRNVIFIRMGTCGGLGVEAGTVVVTDKAVDGALSTNAESLILGEKVYRPAVIDTDIVDELMTLAQDGNSFPIARGATLCTDDYYEGQGRLDGIFCEYNENQKMDFLRKLYEDGVRNIEMESLCFAAMCHKAGHKCAVVCVAFLDRFKGDQARLTPEVKHDYEQRPVHLVAKFIKRRMESL